MTSLVGRLLLSQFRVDDFIDSGKMGAVYLVWDLQRNANLAMKVIHGELAEDPSVLKRFKREANALKKLTHPNIVPFYGLYNDDGLFFLLEAYIKGLSLKEYLDQQGGLSLNLLDGLTIMRALCAALGYAHEHGVVHCDIKPGNVLLDQWGMIYLTDFGIARHAESTTTTLASAGTPAYMAPEQIRGEAVTPATDVYALGVLLFEMLTGQRPFRGDEAVMEKADRSLSERIRYAHQNLVPPEPRTLNPKIPEALSEVILRALSKKPSQRYRSTQSFYQAILYASGFEEKNIPERFPMYDKIYKRYPSDHFSDEDKNREKKYKKLALIGISIGILVFFVIRVLPEILSIRTTTLQNPGGVPQVTLAHSPSPTELPTFTSIPSRTPTESINDIRETPKSTPKLSTRAPPQLPKLQLDVNSFCRGGPGTGYDKIWTFSTGDVLDIVGKDGDWWLVQFFEPRTRHDMCWIHTNNGMVTGDTSDIPSSNYRTEK